MAHSLSRAALAAAALALMTCWVEASPARKGDLIFPAFFPPNFDTTSYIINDPSNTTVRGIALFPRGSTPPAPPFTAEWTAATRKVAFTTAVDDFSNQVAGTTKSYLGVLDLARTNPQFGQLLRLPGLDSGPLANCVVPTSFGTGTGDGVDPFAGNNGDVAAHELGNGLYRVATNIECYQGCPTARKAFIVEWLYDANSKTVKGPAAPLALYQAGGCSNGQRSGKFVRKLAYVKGKLYGLFVPVNPPDFRLNITPPLTLYRIKKGKLISTGVNNLKIPGWPQCATTLSAIKSESSFVVQCRRGFTIQPNGGAQQTSPNAGTALFYIKKGGKVNKYRISPVYLAKDGAGVGDPAVAPLASDVYGLVSTLTSTTPPASVITVTKFTTSGKIIAQPLFELGPFSASPFVVVP